MTSVQPNDKAKSSKSPTKVYHKTTTLKCANCGGPAVFTEEGPNDEYPEPLCEKCEGGT